MTRPPVQAPPQPRPCDICGQLPAPFGFARPGGRAARKPGTRSLMCCADPACLAAATARWQAAQAPLRGRDQAQAAAATPAPQARPLRPAPRAPDPAQPSLI